MKAIAETLGVSRSNLARRMRETLPKRRGRYSKASDAEVMPAIRTAIDERSTYGYRRIAAVVNRDRAAQGLPLLNHKRVYRIMAQNGVD